MKYNVDGAANGCTGEAGIGGIMRNDEGNIKIVFSKAIGVEDASAAEVRAIREAFLSFAGSKWVATHSLILKVTRKMLSNGLTTHPKRPGGLGSGFCTLKGSRRRLSLTVSWMLLGRSVSISCVLLRGPLDDVLCFWP
ncbi:Uncharacterized protein TCM_020213 [Theobroma cacao]|uniref:RNase H type-1 domain-containing protein n=1 Tax=Theobroma cacao TaxID=3641 RepID=A0A061EJU9_THECC|nr:Uncharacterized protein TCM_020213 [Theobroma cacao]